MKELILNPTNASVFKSVENCRKTISNLWHKFIIHDGIDFDIKLILKSIVECGDDIFPIQCESDGKNVSFIARNCTQAIDNLCERNLTLNYDNSKKPVILSIHINLGIPNETTLHIEDVIKHVIRKRFSQDTGVLNLENFVNDPDLNNKVYCTISQEKVFMFVLSLSSGLDVKCLRLNHNEMTNIHGLEVITSACPLLYSIDLRNNLITSISELKLLKNFHITELWLDENPLCEMYENYNYILTVKEICPKLERLDGEEIFQDGIPLLRRNYMIKYSSIDLINQFLEHYFTLYDTNRELLIDLYHLEALFSITTSLIPDQITSTTRRLEEFERINRNLLTQNDNTKHEKWLYHSREDIVKILCKMSPTQHDPFSFTVDVLYNSNETIVIFITGVFRLDEIIYDYKNLLYFSRIFVLLATSTGEYHIVNEQLYISNATTSQTKNAFQNNIFTDKEQLCFIETMIKICETDMNTAKRLLETANWDLKTALKLFVNQSIQQITSKSIRPTKTKPSKKNLRNNKKCPNIITINTTDNSNVIQNLIISGSNTELQPKDLSVQYGNTEISLMNTKDISRESSINISNRQNINIDVISPNTDILPESELNSNTSQMYSCKKQLKSKVSIQKAKKRIKNPRGIICKKRSHLIRNCLINKHQIDSISQSTQSISDTSFHDGEKQVDQASKQITSTTDPKPQQIFSRQIIQENVPAVSDTTIVKKKNKCKQKCHQCGQKGHMQFACEKSTGVKDTKVVVESTVNTGGTTVKKKKRKKHIKCLHCGKQGHSRISCWNLTGKNHSITLAKNKNNLPPLCSYCKKKRHELKLCKKRRLDIQYGIFNGSNGSPRTN